MSEGVDLVKLTEETKKLTAMVVEDEVVANETLCSTFKSFFLNVTSACSGEQALGLIKENKIDIIFVDVVMPGMDGIELSRRLRELNPNQIIIVISASDNIEQISRSIDIGVNSFMQKPIDAKKIIELLKTVVALAKKKKKIETKTFSISLPLEAYNLINDNAKGESTSKNSIIIRTIRSHYEKRS